MQRATVGSTSGLDRRLEGLRDHRTLGRLVRLYLDRRQPVRYLVVGGWNTLFGYGFWAMLQFLLGERLHYLLIVLIAWPIAVLNAYLGYRYLVFESRGPILRELPRFSVVYVVTLLANLSLLPVALALLPFNIYVVQALLTAIVVAASYFSHRTYSFGASHRVAPPTASSNRAPETSEE